MEQNYFSQITYPSSLTEVTENSYLIGWNAEQFHCTIAFAISKKVAEYNVLTNVLKAVYQNPSFILAKHHDSKFHHLQSGKHSNNSHLSMPVVLGEWYPEIGDVTPHDIIPDPEHQQRSIWIILTKTIIQDAFPNMMPVSPSLLYEEEENAQELMIRLKLLSIYSLGCRYDTSCYLLAYHRPNTDHLHYITLDSIDKQSYPDIVAGNTISPKYEEKVTQAELSTIIHQINAAYDLGQFTDRFLSQKHSHHQNSLFSTMSVSPYLKAVLLSLATLTYPVLLVVQVMVKITTYDHPLITWWYHNFRWKNLVSVGANKKRKQAVEEEDEEETVAGMITLQRSSFVFYTLTDRCHQIYEILSLSIILPTIWNHNIPLRQRIWTRCSELLVSMFIDLLLGWCLGYLCYYHSQEIITTLSSFFLHCRIQIITILAWYNNSPGGVKLNPMITRKMGGLIRYLIVHYAYLLLKFQVYYQAFLQLIACLNAGGGGLSFLIAMCLDLFRLVTLPCNTFHTLFAHLYGFLIRLLYSLWLLFRGQKKNVLRDRVDTYNYDQSELLFGVMFFSIIFFSLPNLAAYHYLFVGIRIMTVFSLFITFQAYILFKNFPWVALSMYYLIDPLLQQSQVILTVDSVQEEEKNPLHLSSSTALLPTSSALSYPPHHHMEQLDELEGFIHGLSPKARLRPKRSSSSSFSFKKAPLITVATADDDKIERSDDDGLQAKQDDDDEDFQHNHGKRENEETEEADVDIELENDDKYQAKEVEEEEAAIVEEEDEAALGDHSDMDLQPAEHDDDEADDDEEQQQDNSPLKIKETILLRRRAQSRQQQTQPHDLYAASNYGVSTAGEESMDSSTTELWHEHHHNYNQDLMITSPEKPVIKKPKLVNPSSSISTRWILPSTSGCSKKSITHIQFSSPSVTILQLFESYYAWMIGIIIKKRSFRKLVYNIWSSHPLRINMIHRALEIQKDLDQSFRIQLSQSIEHYRVIHGQQQSRELVALPPLHGHWISWTDYSQLVLRQLIPAEELTVCHYRYSLRLLLISQILIIAQTICLLVGLYVFIQTLFAHHKEGSNVTTTNTMIMQSAGIMSSNYLDSSITNNKSRLLAKDVSTITALESTTASFTGDTSSVSLASAIFSTMRHFITSSGFH